MIKLFSKAKKPIPDLVLLDKLYRETIVLLDKDIRTAYCKRLIERNLIEFDKINDSELRSKLIELNLSAKQEIEKLGRG